MPTIDETIAFVRSAFSGVTDLSGVPFAEHCIRVMRYLPADATDDERHAALLHDVLEDLPVTTADLRDMGYSERTVWLVEQLTRLRSETYMDFIRRIKATGDAGLIAIKLADIADNSDPERIAALPEAERGIVRRYDRARRALTE